MPRLGLALGVLAALLFVAFWSFRSEPPRPSAEEGEGPLEPTDWFFRQRAFPHATIDPAAFRRALGQARALREAAEQRGGAPWDFAGPTNVGGRVAALAVESFDVFYVGTASGGVLKTTDGGQTFTPVGDDVLSLSTGDVTLDPQDPQTVYVGTGEVNGGGGSLTYGGRGVYRSTDGGATWAHLGLDESGTIGRIVVHPTNPAVLWVAAAGKLYATDAHRGVFRSTDGGQSWDRTLFVNDSTGAVDLAINPQNPDVVYAATWERQRRPHERRYGGDGSGLYRSTDGGQTWAELTNGLPTDADVGRIGVAVAASDPSVLYAVYTDAVGYVRGVFRSADGGDSWQPRTAVSGPSFGWWFGQIRVDPTNPNVVYVPWLDLFKSTNGGASWQYATGIMHVDQHALWIDPANPSRLVAGNDGGVYRSTTGASSWAKATGAFPATQFYAVEIDASEPHRLYGGAQDNGTNRTLTGGLGDWQHILGGDGLVPRVDPTNNQFVYAEYQYGALHRSTNGGASFSYAMSGVSGGDRINWKMPYTFDPLDPATMYLGTQRVYRSTNRAASWTPISPDLSGGPGGGNLVYGTLTTLDVAPSDPQTIWAGTDDGHVAITEDGGQTWTDVSAGLPTRWVTRVSVHPDQPRTAYVTLSGYRWGEDAAHVYRTDDGGQSWAPRADGLPEAPVNDLLFDPRDPARLYLASDVGVFTSPDAGLTWQALGAGLPQAPVLDLDLHDGTRSLVAATFGRSMYRYDLTRLPTAAEPAAEAGRLRLEAAPNPFRDAVTFRFTLDRPGAVTLAVYDLRGRQVAVVERGERGAGSHAVRWTAPGGLAAGTYLARLDAGSGAVTVRLTRVR